MLVKLNTERCEHINTPLVTPTPQRPVRVEDGHREDLFLAQGWRGRVRQQGRRREHRRVLLQRRQALQE
jgi:hypothetical protein